ncbi:hypothetical protein [uncultured Brachyspira sp.]|uniref:LysM peptidoglycan-binding domain-containing protein n=1 Tax=uncultured Brachyspira sp. TaxID=221953 RepID=UPI0026363792|nr:hypothetical protein [uncultured Brachyspira sp.]
MKKGLFLFITLYLSCFLYGQDTNNISETDDYKLAQRYREMAIEAHEAGDYNKSIEYSQLSKEYSDKIISRYGFYQYVLNSQKDAEKKLSLFKGVGGDSNELTTTLYGLSVNDINSANNMFKTATNGVDYTNTMLEYNKSADKSELGYNVLSIDLRREYLMQESVLTNGDNNDLQITSLRDDSKKLLSDGDYTNSLTSSRDAMAILDKLEAPLAYAKAQEAMEKARKDGLNEKDPNLYNELSNSLASASKTLSENKYSESLMHSKNVTDLVNLMENNALAMNGNNNTDNNNINGGNTDNNGNNADNMDNNNYIYDGNFPQYYVVQLRKANTDSLWLIASYDFIYGDGNFWRKIYEANKDQIKDPNIITDGQILLIPSLKGETREGTYDPNKKYDNINNITAKENTSASDNNEAMTDENEAAADNEAITDENEAAADNEVITDEETPADNEMMTDEETE